MTSGARDRANGIVSSAVTGGKIGPYRGRAEADGDGCKTRMRVMVIDANLRSRLTEALRTVDDRGTAGPRLHDDAARLWSRAQKLAMIALVSLGEAGEREAIAAEKLAVVQPGCTVVLSEPEWR